MLLASGPVSRSPQETLSQLGALGARLVLQRAVEEEVDELLGRLRYERKADAPPGKRNGWRPRTLKSAEGCLCVHIPQVREAAQRFVSELFPRGERFLSTEPRKALVT